jgi:4-hydroxybenzoate polyprenyltransferase
VLAPVVTSHQVMRIPVLLAALACMAAFSLTASALYLINDLYDLEDDRQHARKCHRPLACGRIPLLRGLLAIPLLLVGAALCLWPLPISVAGVVALYFCLTLAYSACLKRLVLIDVICLATLYILRIIAGHEAAKLVYTPWLLAFAMFLFFSLAMVKRYSELKDARESGRAKLGGRDYHAGDLEIVATLGTGSGLIAVLVMALYINSSAVQLLYKSPNLLLPICPLVLYWISRVWLLAHRGKVHEDPVIFALRDPASYVVGILCGAVMVTASLF